VFARQRHALIFGAVLLAVGAAMAVLVGADPVDPAFQRVDDRFLDWIVEHRTDLWIDIAKVVSVLGAPVVMVPLRLLVTAGLLWHRRWLQLGAWLGAIVTSELCIGPLKALLDRPRPPDPLIDTNSASFPSGHAIAASVTAIGLVVVLHPPVRERYRWTAVAAAFAVVMALGRTVLSAHWLTDVIGGGCLGVGLAVVWPAGLELIRGRVLPPRPEDFDEPPDEPSAPDPAASSSV
jgi:undecaprenyl-diphosphatase